MVNPFSLHGRVARAPYLAWGIGLMALKYAVDALVTWYFTHAVLTPLMFVSPLAKMRMPETPNAMVATLAVLSLPFLWSGFAMTMRRAVDAGRTPFSALLFFVPVVNLVAMVVFAILPSSTSTESLAQNQSKAASLRTSFVAVGVSTIVCLLLLVVDVYVIQGYATALFFGVPFMTGMLAGYLFNRSEKRSVAATVIVGTLVVAIIGLAILVFALEGAICIFMAGAPALLTSIAGALLGRAFASNNQMLPRIAVVLLALPIVAWTETNNALPLREVVSSIEIDAPPDVVFENVVHFPELPRPTSIWFRAGIAYPQRARIVGTGVGAIRYCEFSTGPFVEPITRWEAPRRLSFDVSAQPPAMRELSPYGNIRAPHLDGYLRSKRGEFRLVPLPNNRTRLEGSTWYELDVHPNWYWSLWSDAFIHQIHMEVLTHVRSISEGRGADRIATTEPSASL